MKMRCNKQTGITIPFCKFNTDNHAFGCCGYSRRSGAFFDFLRREFL